MSKATKVWQALADTEAATRALTPKTGLYHQVGEYQLRCKADDIRALKAVKT